MKLQAVFLLIILFLQVGTVQAEIYSYIDSSGRLTYTSDPNELPQGAPPSAGETGGSATGDASGIDAKTIRLEYLNQQLELAKLDFDNKFAALGKTSVEDYEQAIQDILNLKVEMVDLNEELIGLTAKTSEERELLLQRLYAWSEKVDLLLEKDRRKNGPQARSTRLQILGLSVEEVKRSDSSITYSIKVEVDNPGEDGVAAIKVAGIGVDGHIVESKVVKGEIGREQLKTFYDTTIVDTDTALHLSGWEVVESAIH